MTARTEYRVLWRRAGWRPTTATKSRVVPTHAAAMRFIDRLRRAEGRSPLSLVRVQRRAVGAWSDVEGVAR